MQSHVDRSLFNTEELWNNIKGKLDVEEYHGYITKELKKIQIKSRER